MRTTIVIPDLALSQGLEDVDRRFEDGIRVRPPLDGEPCVLAILVDLDCGLAEGGVNTSVLAQPPPLMARLVLPAASQPQQLLQQGAANVLGPDGTTGYVSAQTTALVLILAMFFGAAPAVVLILAMCFGTASAAFVFHERLAQTVVQWQTGRKSCASSSGTQPSTRT
jgi:hypothetical protein